MEKQIKRTRLTAVYLTSTERDLVRHALTHLSNSLRTTALVKCDSDFAKSYSAQRLEATAALFEDNPAKG